MEAPSRKPARRARDENTAGARRQEAESRESGIEPLRRGRGHDVEAAEDLGHDLAAVEPEKGGLIVQRPSDWPSFFGEPDHLPRRTKKGPVLWRRNRRANTAEDSRRRSGC